MENVLTGQSSARQCLERLVELARQKQAVLKERRHADLPGIVSAEEEVLACLEQLRSNRGSGEFDEEVAEDKSPESVAQIATAVAELKQLNSANAALLQEHLAAVDTCLSLIERIASPTYSPEGSSKDENVVRRVLDVRA